MSERTFTIEMIDMDLADLDTGEFLGLTPSYLRSILLELKRCYEEVDEYDELVGLLIENHFVESSPYETVKHLIETHQDYKTSE